MTTKQETQNMNATEDRPAYLNAVTVLRRSRKADTYHRANCSRLHRDSLPWKWAEGKTRAEVEATAVNGLKPCGVCDPLGALPVEVTT